MPRSAKPPKTPTPAKPAKPASPKPASSSRKRGPQGRADILRVALRVFAARGYRGATTAAIAREAGVAQPLVHHHFGSKDGLWHAVLAEVFEDLRETLRAAAPPVEGPATEARIRGLLGAFIAFVGRRPELSQLIRTESSASSPQYEHLYTTWLADMVAFFHSELAAAVAAGILRPMPPELVYSFMVGACSQPFSEAETLRRAFGVDVARPAFVESYRDLVIDALLDGMRPR